MKNRDSRKAKRAERQIETAGKLPFHRVDKLEKIRRHQVPEKYIDENFNKKK